MRRQWAEELAAEFDKRARTAQRNGNTGDTRYTSYRDSARIVREYGEKP